MSKASDILRVWADDPKTANDTIRLPLRAVADLMGDIDRCDTCVCGAYLNEPCSPSCTYAALERAITGERERESDGKTE